MVRKLIFTLIIILFAGYLGFEGRGLLFPPSLVIFSPQKDFVTNERVIELSGQTEPGVQVAVNGIVILPDEKGYFQKQIVLEKGLNILEIQTIKRYARPHVLERKIFVSLNKPALSQSQQSKPKL